MIRWKPQVAIPSDLQSLRLAHAALRREWEAVKREYYARKAGFDPNQPRVPAGSSEGGQWTSEGGGASRASPAGGSTSVENTSRLRFADASGVLGSTVMTDAYQDLPVILAAGKRPSPQYCWNQYRIDLLYCGSLQPSWYREACRSQAAERFSACGVGKPLPPLPF